ncbi:hypothetical protein [Nocardia sp. NBC_00416]|uniref:hypothetical protein n=1 Tax=Nocardia sp. NBC_00416 TaxID=2975991 RepID=UPI002E21A31C
MTGGQHATSGDAGTRVLVSMSEIAAMARVRRPVVSTWRRRHRDFPAPATGQGDRLFFDGEQIARWLTSTGLGNADAEQLRTELVLYGIAAVQHSMAAGRFHSVEILGALLCLRHLDEKPLCDNTVDGTRRQSADRLLRRAERMDPEDEFLLRELRAAGEQTAPLAVLAEDMVEAAYSEHGAYEWLLAHRARLELPDLTADAVVPELLRLLIDLAELPARIERDDSITLADPHARTGDLLAGLIRGTDDAGEITVLAAEPDERLARVTRRRLLLAGVDEVSLDVQIGRDLDEDIGYPDILVTQLPYRPGESRKALTALQELDRIAVLLGPGCTAVVLGPADALVEALRGTSEAQARAKLLRAEVVESVIALPGGLLPYRPGYRPAIWTLTREPVVATKGYALLIDISSEPLTEPVRTRLTEDVLLWRAEGSRRLDGHDPRYGRAVEIEKLDRAFGAPLTPTAPPTSEILARHVRERPALIADAEIRLEQATVQARTHEESHGRYRGHVVHRATPRPDPTTLGKLIAQGRVTKVKGHRIAAEHTGPDGHHYVIGPDEITGRTPLGARRLDRITLVTHYEHVTLTEPGDIVYTTAPELGLLVDDGFRIAAFPARVLRVNPEARAPLTPRVLAALLGAARGTARSPSAVRPARRIEDYLLPDLSPDDVRRFDAVLAEIEQREQLLRAQAEVLAEVRRLTVAGLADGTLTIDPTITTEHPGRRSNAPA